MSVNAPVQIDRQRIRELIEREEKRLNDATSKSAEMFKRAHEVLSGGVASSYQLRDPWPIYLEKGDGPRVWDVDGNEYLDFHNGFGVMCVGHANPVIAAAVKARMDEGTHFAAPTDGSIKVAEEMRRRWGLPQWRFTNSGTESTMDAVHLARARRSRHRVRIGHGPALVPRDPHVVLAGQHREPVVQRPGRVLHGPAREPRRHAERRPRARGLGLSIARRSVSRSRGSPRR